MNDEYISVLESSLLFKNISGAEIERLVHSSQTGTKEYKKGERVFSESDRPDKLLILLSGKLLVAKDTVSGKRLVLATIDQPGDLFGEVYPFVEKEEYDMYVETAQKSVVFSIGLDFFYETQGRDRQMSDQLRENLFRIFAQKAYKMNHRIRVLGAPGIREKIARFLIERQVDGPRIRMMPREEMADYLNVTRPSLSRELSNMVKDGIIRNEGRDIVIIDQDKLESYL